MNFAIDYNNLGVVYYDADQFDEAIRMFNKAVDLVLKSTQEQESTREDLEKHSQQVALLKEESKSCISDSPTGLLGTSTSSSNIKSDTPYSIFTYQRPYPLPPLGTGQVSKRDISSSQLEVEMSSTMLFNLGLAYHVKFLYSQDLSFREKSLKLYDLAIQSTISCEELTLPQEDSSLIIHLQVSILNNLATLFHQMGHYQHSLDYLNEMNELISVHFESLTDFGDEGCGFFQMNYHVLVEPSTALAA